MRAPPGETRRPGRVGQALRNPFVAVSIFVLLALCSIVLARHNLGLFTDTGELEILLLAGSACIVAVF